MICRCYANYTLFKSTLRHYLLNNRKKELTQSRRGMSHSFFKFFLIFKSSAIDFLPILKKLPNFFLRNATEMELFDMFFGRNEGDGSMVTKV